MRQSSNVQINAEHLPKDIKSVFAQCPSFRCAGVMEFRGNKQFRGQQLPFSSHFPVIVHFHEELTAEESEIVSSITSMVLARKKNE